MIITGFGSTKTRSGGNIIFLNAPKLAGKDTIAKALNDLTNCNIMSFKEPMFKIAAAMTGLSLATFMKYYEDREMKENPCDAFMGLSGRNLLIKISEEFCKPNFGEEYFGKVAVKKMNSRDFYRTGYVFSDSGFYSEIVPIAEMYGASNCFVVQFVRQGSESFEGDSRDWVSAENIGVTTIKMTRKNDNDVTPQEFAEDILTMINYAKESQ